jgi:membrane protease YdiL (CAAX protease family)
MGNSQTRSTDVRISGGTYRSRPRERARPPRNGDAAARVEETTAVPPTLRAPDAREVVAVAWTFGANVVVHRVLHHATHVPANLIAAGGVVGLAASAGASARDLGLVLDELPRGARLGLGAGAAIATGVALAAALPATRPQFADRRVSEVGGGRAAYELLVRIPIGTALAEELLFRSALPALFAQRHSARAAALASAALFGLWHVLPTVASIDSHPVGAQIGVTPSHRASAVAGVVATTAVAGLAFGWLRRRAGSVIAPAIAHAVLNASTYAAGRLVTRVR